MVQSRLLVQHNGDHHSGLQSSHFCTLEGPSTSPFGNMRFLFHTSCNTHLYGKPPNSPCLHSEEAQLHHRLEGEALERELVDENRLEELE